MTEQKHSGRLELTWTNKDKALWMPDPEDLSDKECPYQWVERDDPRVQEIRPLRRVDAVGEESDNLLIQGDSLEALKALANDPQYSKKLLGKVKLIYIDPPFNTGQAFEQYDDSLDHSVWLSMMRDRLVELKRFLSPQGSIWVHLDDVEVHRMRCLLDDIFGASNFVASVVWQKRYSRDNRPALGSVHDWVLIYSPAGTDWKHVRNRIPRMEAKNYRNPNSDPRGLWRPIPMTAQGYRANQMYEIETPSGVVHTPPKGRCWSMIEPTFRQLLDEGRIYFGLKGDAQPGVIRYLDEDEGLVPWSWWPSDEVGHNDESKKEMLSLFSNEEAFATPKPERLMERIVHIATDPGDSVLDCFAGSGTTAAVAHKMGRKWVTIERESDTVSRYTKPRLDLVVSGGDQGGISSREKTVWVGEHAPEDVDPDEATRAAEVLKSMFESGHLEAPLRKMFPAAQYDDSAFPEEASKLVKSIATALRRTDKTSKEKEVLWNGGGGFQVLEVADPLWELDSDGDPVLRQGLPNQSDFQQSVRVNLGFTLVNDRDGFTGRRGRQMLGVVMGLVDEREVRQFASRLREGERALIVGTAVTSEARLMLAELSKGSSLIKAPDHLFAKFGRVIR